jgi:hypothetical protein
LIRYRSFENWDPPALAEIWRTQPPLRGRMQAVTPPLLEQHVLAKPWFERSRGSWHRAGATEAG